MFNNIFNSNKEEIIGIDIGLSSLKYIEIIINNKDYLLKEYKEIFLGPLIGKEKGDISNIGIYDFSKVIIDFVGDNNTKDICLGYPANRYSIFSLSLPLESEDLEDFIIPIETKKYFDNFDISLYDIKYEVLPKGTLSKDRIDYVVSISKKQDIQLLKDILIKNKLNIINIEPNSLGSVRILSGISNEIIIDIGSVWSTLSFLKNGILIHMESIDMGGVNITNSLKNSLLLDFKSAESIKTSKKDTLNQNIIDIINFSVYNLANELLNICHNVSVRYNYTFDNIVLTGGCSSIFDIEEVFKDVFEDKNIIFRNAFHNIKYYEKDIQFPQEISNTFSNCLGLAIAKYKK